MNADLHQTTSLLRCAAGGDGIAAESLAERLYPQIRAIAADRLADERPGHTLQPTALANEAFVRLIDQRVGFENRGHFLAIVARMIRRILVDHARAKHAAKRGGDRTRVPMTDLACTDDPVDLLELDEALVKLRRLHERQADVVELRFFGGLTTAETAAFLEVNRSTVTDDWTVARAWLAVELSHESPA